MNFASYASVLRYGAAKVGRGPAGCCGGTMPKESARWVGSSWKVSFLVPQNFGLGKKFGAHGWFVFKSSPYDLFPPHPLVMVGWNDSISLEAACPNLHGWLWFWDMLVIVVWGVYVCKGLWFGTLGVGV